MWKIQVIDYWMRMWIVPNLVESTCLINYSCTDFPVAVSSFISFPWTIVRFSPDGAMEEWHLRTDREILPLKRWRPMTSWYIRPTSGIRSRTDWGLVWHNTCKLKKWNNIFLSYYLSQIDVRRADGDKFIFSWEVLPKGNQL